MSIMATILLVEDDEDTLHAFRLLLERAGYQVMLARSGKEALAKILEIAVDLVITDWSMPGMDGVALCRTLRTNPKFSRLPIVLMSANQPPTDEGLWHAFLRKPVSWPTIAQTVRSLVTTPPT
ncbi:response regulator [Burkholderia cenocepacia]|uniref:response regulator n=2 Tax=Burkholderia cenocepacia TaxID=95486 RepID=UPI0009B0247E